MRVLLVGHDAGGTVPPLVAIGAAGVDAGHEVVVLGQPSMRGRAEAAGCRFTPFSALGDYRRDVPLEEQLDLGGAAIVGPAVGTDLVAAAGQLGADVVVVDANLAGALAAAETLPIPSAVLLHSMYATFVTTWFGDLWPFLAGGINDTRATLGLAPVDGWAAVFAPHDALLSVVPAAFDAPVPQRPATLHHHGFLVPAGPAGPTAAPASGDPIAAFPPGDGPTVLVSLSTTDQGQGDLLQAIVDGLAGTDVRALVTTGGHPGSAALRPAPNVAVAEFVPHQAVLPATDVVVTHAGLGTVATALAHGVPLVGTPIARDQHLNTERLEALGVGRGCPDPTPEAVAAAVRAVTSDPTYTERAGSLARASRAAGGAPAVIATLAELADRSRSR